MSEESWGAIRPTTFESTRAVLDFGLARATRDFNEWAFPGIGGVAFARQFAWGVMALRLAPQCQTRSQRPMVVAEALEALASFIAIHRVPDYADSARIRGKRKLADNRDNFSYTWLRNRANYVSQPMRMGTTAGLVGCGLASGPVARFDRLRLTDEGLAIADTILNRRLDGKSQRRTVKSWLLEDWIDADGDVRKAIPRRVRDVLLPGPSTEAEPIPSVSEIEQLSVLVSRNPTRCVMRDALAVCKAELGVDGFYADMSSTAGQGRLLRAIGDTHQRRRVRAGIAYGHMTAAALNVLNTLAIELADRRQNNQKLILTKLPLSVTRLLDKLSAATVMLSERLTEARLTQADAMTFCSQQHPGIAAGSRLEALVARTKDVFSVIGGDVVFGRVYRAELFAAGNAMHGENRADLVLADSDAPGESARRSPVPGRVFRAFSLLDDLCMLDEEVR